MTTTVGTLNFFLFKNQKKRKICDQSTWWEVYGSVSLQRQNCWRTAGCLPAALRTTAPSREEDLEAPPPKAARAPATAAGGAAAGGTGDPPVSEAKALAIMAASMLAFWAVATAAAVPAAAGAPLLAPCSADSAPPIKCKRDVTTF